MAEDIYQISYVSAVVVKTAFIESTVIGMQGSRNSTVNWKDLPVSAPPGVKHFVVIVYKAYVVYTVDKKAYSLSAELRIIAFASVKERAGLTDMEYVMGQ